MRKQATSGFRSLERFVQEFIVIVVCVCVWLDPSYHHHLTKQAFFFALPRPIEARTNSSSEVRTSKHLIQSSSAPQSLLRSFGLECRSVGTFIPFLSSLLLSTLLFHSYQCHMLVVCITSRIGPAVLKKAAPRPAYMYEVKLVVYCTCTKRVSIGKISHGTPKKIVNAPSIMALTNLHA